MRHTFNTLADILEYSTYVNAGRLVSDFTEGGQSYTFTQFREKCDELSGLLCTFGISVSDKVAILSENMPNWAVAFFSVTAYGRIAVPMLPEVSPNEVENILSHSGAKAIFVSEKQIPKISKERMDGLCLVIDINTFQLLKAEDPFYTCDGRIKVPAPMDIAAILYTSGTTGNAKGVMLSHRNLCWNVTEAWYAHKVGRRDVFLSVLPLAHTYEMSIGMLYPFAMGASVYYLQKPPTPTILMKTLKKIRPTAMLSVPLIMEKIYKNSILPTISSSKFLSHLQEHWPLLLYRLVGIKLKKTFGGRIRFFGIGGSKLDVNIESFLSKTGFPYAIGYGLTETAPLICNAPPHKTHVGTTGTAAYGVQVKLIDVDPETGQGELVVKGPNVMLGYYKDFKRTMQVKTADGWFRTGDIASVDKKGRYSIQGRSGNVIIGSSGENIYPEEIESVINFMKEVNESLVISRDGHLVALVQFNDGLIDWNLEGQDKFMEMIEERKQSVKDFVNSKVSRFLKINEVEVMREPFHRTATHKIKRFLYQDKKRAADAKDGKIDDAAKTGQKDNRKES